MARRVHTISIFDGGGIDELIRAVEDEKERLSSGVKELVRKSAALGEDAARAGFAAARYDGTRGQDTVSREPGEEGAASASEKVRADGPTAAFIEYGTGITFPDSHPEMAEAKAQGLAGRGEYGKGYGSRRAWGYYGDPGSSGQVIRSGKKGQLVITRGNPANMPMYNSVKTVLAESDRLIEEAFGHD